MEVKYAMNGNELGGTASVRQLRLGGFGAYLPCGMDIAPTRFDTFEKADRFVTKQGFKRRDIIEAAKTSANK